MLFEWGESKNRSNIAKHKVGFETATAVFNDRHALSVAKTKKIRGTRRKSRGLAWKDGGRKCR
jgi:uncharacterized DUF497 family protein